MFWIPFSSPGYLQIIVTKVICLKNNTQCTQKGRFQNVYTCNLHVYFCWGYSVITHSCCWRKWVSLAEFSLLCSRTLLKDSHVVLPSRANCEVNMCMKTDSILFPFLIVVLCKVCPWKLFSRQIIQINNNNNQHFKLLWNDFSVVRH